MRLNFMIKDKNMFDKYMTVWGKVSNIIKRKFNSELIYNKKYLKAETRFKAKESFQCFYIPVILFDSVGKRWKLLSKYVFRKIYS